MGRRRAAGQLSLCPVLNALTCMYDDERKKKEEEEAFLQFYAREGDEI